MGDQVLSDFYDETKLESIYLEFAQADYWQMLHDATADDTTVVGALRYGDKTLDSIGVQFKGNTSYSKITTEDKLSFDISLDAYIKGQDIEGYNTLNLNNAYQDFTFMREVFYLHQNRKNIPAAQGNFVKLYINNEYWGIYCNVQQLNTDFTREWFMTNNGSLWRANADRVKTVTTNAATTRPGAGGGTQWGDGTTALNYLGEDTALYQANYTLKSSKQDNAWELLVKVTDILNNTADDVLIDSLSNYLDIDRTIWFLAHELAFSDDDGYVYKGRQDYYVYYEPETGRFTPLEFDGNSVMHTKNVEWRVFKNAAKVNYPLMNRLFGIPEMRQRYLAHMRSIVGDLFDTEATNAILDDYYDLITADVKADPKKLFTNTEYEAAFIELKEFISTRREFILSNAEVNVTPLTIEKVAHTVNNEEFANPNASETVEVTASVNGDIGVSAVYLYYATGYVGNFTKVTMADNGDGSYSQEIPAHEAGEYVRYYVEAIGNNTAKTATYCPVGAEHDVYLYRVNMAEEIISDVVINEVMASNKTAVADDSAKYEDWIEIYNNSSEAISLDGYYLTDNATELMKWAFPDIEIAGNDYLTLWCDKDEEEGPLHTNFKLSSDGEEILLVSPDLYIADQVFFTSQKTDISYARIPNGTGPFVLATPTHGEDNGTVNNVVENEALNLVIYPNPASDIIYIASEDTNLNIDIYTASGQLVISTTYYEGGIEVSQLREGLYILSIASDSGQSSSKIMIR